MTMYKIVVLGDGGVGKSCITIQFTQNHFVKEYDPTIENSYRKQITLDDESLMLDILYVPWTARSRERSSWIACTQGAHNSRSDTAGQEEYSVMRDQYINSGQGFLLVYSVTSKRSFETSGELKDKIIQVKEREHYPIVLCGNKCDLEKERKVTTEEGREKAKEWEVPFFETSAKARINVEESFFQLVRMIKSAELNCAKESNGPQRPKKKDKKGLCSLL